MIEPAEGGAAGDRRKTLAVVLTDHPWADVALERSIIEGAGFRLVIGPEVAGSESDIEALVESADPAAILTCWAPVSRKAIMSPRTVRIVARLGVGLDNIDVAAAAERGAWVTNVPDYCVEEVSNHAVALVLDHCRGISRLNAAVKEKGWNSDATGLLRLSDLTVGILGYGRIGRETARKFKAFGCGVLAHDPAFTADDDNAYAANMDAIQSAADIVILHVPLIPATQGLLNEDFFARLQRRPLIVNVSRGPLIDNEALLNALGEGRIRGAALDVIDGEPTPPLEILSHARVVATPHIAYASDASMEELRRRACEEVVRVLQGYQPQEPRNTPARKNPPEGVPLDGGVASDVRVVDSEDGPIVIKAALPKLKVAADWFSDPGRSLIEADAIRACTELLGKGPVPELVWEKPDEHAFAMRLVDPRLRNWKTDLMSGAVDLRTAERAGRLLGLLHARSAERPDLAERFGDIQYFHELRIEPFFEHVAEKLPHLAADMEAVVSGMLGRRCALVHGDFSPKNLLADGGDLVILDFEVAHWGDPRFDVGFCLTHLILKSSIPGMPVPAFQEAIETFLGAYGATGLDIIDTDLARIVGCLLLARLHGKSPVEYGDRIDRQSIENKAIQLLWHDGEVGLEIFQLSLESCG
ncbi:NAD(P)-dependent oxidoreductase [Novosphingobium sp.]|uniref:NAD(P)-dependent oxidoreductase n=1 Tax=Novosphingobium sp. TaxID=1874826 RepID=UPI002FDB777A